MKPNLYFMNKQIKINVETIKESFNYDYYEKYLNGLITRYKLQELLNCSDYELQLVFKDLKLKTRYDYLHNNTNHDFFDIIDKEEKAYILGLYLADGCLLNDKYISFSQTEKDKELVYLVKQFLCPNCHVGIKKKKKFSNEQYICKPMYRIRICSEHIHKTLEHYGMGERKTYSVNTDLSFIPKNQMIHFIRGYFDGDGTISLTKGVRSDGYEFENVTWRITSYKKDHLVIIHDFLNEYDIHSSIIKEKRGNYIISVDRKKDFIKLRDLLYNDATLYLKRKKEKFFSFMFNKKPLNKKVKTTNIITNKETIYESQSEAARYFGVSTTSLKKWIEKNKIVNDLKIEIV